MRTNRDLHAFIAAFPPAERSLETYLRALAALLATYRDRDGLALDTFAALLREALASAPATDPPTAPNAVEALLWRQIGELPRLRFSRRHWDYAAVEGSDSRWYNADVEGFLDRGVVGGFGGDEEDVAFLSWDDIRAFLVQGQWYE